jgi:hypothetical protein
MFLSSEILVEDSGGGLLLYGKTKPVIKIYGFEDIDLIDSKTALTLRRQILDRL